MGGFFDGIGSATYDVAEGFSRASQRQFDDDPGGGAFDLDTYVPGMSSPGSDADVNTETGQFTATEDERAGNFATSVLGSVPRQFDDASGGGFGDETVDQTTDAIGEAGDAAGAAIADEIANNQAMQVALLFLAVYVIGQLFDVSVGSGTA